MLARNWIFQLSKTAGQGYVCRRGLLTIKESEDLQSEEWYRISKLWLAKLLGKKTMTQQEIDEQIKYLLPSALLCKDARPSLTPPGCVINDWKQIFDKDGNVKSYGYFTNAPRYNDLLYEILRRLYAIGELSTCFENLQDTFPELYHGLDVENFPTLSEPSSTPTTQSAESVVIPSSLAEDNATDEPKCLDVRWVNREELRKITGDKIIHKYQHKFFIQLLEKLYRSEKSFPFMDFISKFMVVLESSTVTSQTVQMEHDGSVRSVGNRKTAMADVILKQGTGIITVNGLLLDDYFKYDIDKLQVYMPFDAIGKRGEFDVTANVISSGRASQAGAMRLAISRALAAISPDYQSILSQAGLLYRDPRLIERKKFGKHKARKSYRFVKR